MSDDRNMGVEFGDLEDDLAGEAYPLSKQDLLSKYGDRELSHASGTDTLRSVLGPEGDDVYEGPEEVRQAVLNMVGEAAVGRQENSDRTTESIPREDEHESL